PPRKPPPYLPSQQTLYPRRDPCTRKSPAHSSPSKSTHSPPPPPTLAQPARVFLAIPSFLLISHPTSLTLATTHLKWVPAICHFSSSHSLRRIGFSLLGGLVELGFGSR
ncbi:hypothetical protein KC19_9G154500, partial [Ceratodon purpureus]